MLAVFQVISGNHDLLYDDLPYDLGEPEHYDRALAPPQKVVDIGKSTVVAKKHSIP
jgi:hypothetical protein